jgi:hypothetical protein
MFIVDGVMANKALEELNLECNTNPFVIEA